MKFFVSYSRSVQEKVREIVTSLRDSGDEVWWDQDLQAGQDWWGTILNNIDACEVCLFMISEKSVQSPYCMEELRYALDRNRLVLPYVMDAPVSYTIPPEILQGRIQYEVYSGTPSQLKHRIRATCQSVNWDHYRNRYTARPPEPNTEANDLVDRLEKAAALANEGHFDEAIKRFNDVSRNDPDSYGDFCHNWIDKIRRYQDVVRHSAVPALKALAKQKWEAFVQQFTGDDFFDPLNIQAKFAVMEAPKKRTGLLGSLSMQSAVSEPAQELTAEEYFQRAFNRTDGHDLKIADYTEAIRLNPNYSEAYQMRGYTYDDKKEYDRAIADYSQAIRLKPQESTAYYNRGLSYEARREMDAAITDYSEAIRLNPQYAKAYFKRGARHTAKGQHDLAIADYDEAIRHSPRYAAAYNGRGSSYAQQGDYNLAIADFSEAILCHPEYGTPYFNRGLSYAELNRHDLAIADYTEAIRLDPLDTDLYYRRGNSYYLQYDYDRAIKDYEMAFQTNPQHELAKNNLQVALNAKKNQGR
jgi:tetratricopeptide (TPR) repeat protein